MAVSLPLGAGRVTRDWLPGDPPTPEVIREARRRIRATVAAQLRPWQRPMPVRVSRLTVPISAPQLLAGALVAEAVLDLLGLDALEICPWALREGIILRRLDAMDQ